MDEPLVLRTRPLLKRMISHGWWVWSLATVVAILLQLSSDSIGPEALLMPLVVITFDGGFAFYSCYNEVHSIHILPEELRLKAFNGQTTRVPYGDFEVFIEGSADGPFAMLSGRVSGGLLFQSKAGIERLMDKGSGMNITGLEPRDLARFVAELEKRVGLCAWRPGEGPVEMHFPMEFIAPMVAGLDRAFFERMHFGGEEPSYRWADSWATAEAMEARNSLECGACGKLRTAASWFTDDHGRLRASCTECRERVEAARRDPPRAVSDVDDHWLAAAVLIGLAKTTLRDPRYPHADTARLALLLVQAAWNRSVGEAPPPAFQGLLREVTKRDPGVWNAFRRLTPDALLDDLQRQVESRFPDNRRPIVNFQMTRGGVVEAEWGDAA